MLITYSYIILIILILSKKIKKNWSIRTSTLITSCILLISKYPMKDSIFALSNNLILDSISILILSLCLLIIPLIILASYKLKNSNKVFIPTIILLPIILIICFSINTYYFSILYLIIISTTGMFTFFVL